MAYLRTVTNGVRWQKDLGPDGTFIIVVELLMGNTEIKRPAHIGSEYFSYKGHFSIILLAVVDTDYRFMWCPTGASGTASDAGVFNGSSLKTALEEERWDLADLDPLLTLAAVEPFSTCTKKDCADSFSLYAFCDRAEATKFRASIVRVSSICPNLGTFCPYSARSST